MIINCHKCIRMLAVISEKEDEVDQLNEMAWRIYCPECYLEEYH